MSYSKEPGFYTRKQANTDEYGYSVVSILFIDIVDACPRGTL